MTAAGVPVWTFGALLIVLWLVSLATGGRFMVRTTLALLLNWAAHLAHWTMFGDPTPYVFSIFADTLTVVVILARPAARMQAVIGWTLLAQIFVHFGYWLHIQIGGYSVEAEDRYWAILDWSALGQIVMIGGWFTDGMARRLFGDGYTRLVPWHRDGAQANDPAGVAAP